jgi:AcrR family transcriptional regulator
MSTRNVLLDGEPDVADRILDAAARCLQVIGRAPVAEVARQAGVSRPTVYRRFADSAAILRALWQREIESLLAGLPHDLADRDALVAAAVELADAISAHHVLASTFVTEPGLMAHYIVDRLGAGQRALLVVMRDAIAAVQPGGSVRAGAPDELAAMVLLIAQSAIQSRHMIAEFLPDDAWRRELARALDGYLRP